MISPRWLIDGSHASATVLRSVLQNAHSVRSYRRTPTLFAGCLPPDVVDRFSATTELRFFVDHQLRPFTPLDDYRSVCSSPHARSPGLNQVLEVINAPSAWDRASGAGVHIAIVDSGIHGAHPEFPAAKKAGGWSYDSSDAWTDPVGHGTMCAVIAAGSPAPAARVCGVAPDARLFSCKTDYSISEVLAAYEWIEDRHDELQSPIVVSNSFGFELQEAPREAGGAIPDDHPMTTVIRRMVANGMPMVFAAGNNHPDNAPQICSPNTIWAWNSLPEVLSVAEVDEHLQVRPYSSRGPGEWAAPHQTKPDCAAPTFGWIVYGQKYDSVVEGWGTSGAAPQVAGLLALMMEQDPKATPSALYQRVRDRCRPLPALPNCVGSGLIDCHATLL
jgi:subtilisin family serine protease